MWRERLIEPLSAPTLFESPVIESQLRPMAMLQQIPDDSGLGGGDVQVYALQLRWAATERLGLIATKDGYVDLELDSGASESGLADIALGLKYAWIDSPESGWLVTPGVVFELASGDEEVFQGNGDGLLRPFVSAGKDFGAWNALGSAGYSLPLDGDAESSALDYHAHLSYELIQNFTPLLELHGIEWIDEGEALPVDFEGGDLINLGASDGGGRVVTGALGARYQLAPRLSLGAAYEWPLTSREDLFEDRVTVDLVWGW